MLTVYNMYNKFAADEAAQALVPLAKDHFPDSSLAKFNQWEHLEGSTEKLH